MARSAANDRRFLELHNGKWRVTVAVPRQLQGQLGTRLKRPLHTDSLAVANRMKWQALSELRAVIDAERKKAPAHPLAAEALELAAYRARAHTDEELELLDEAIQMRADEILGDPVDASEDPLTGGPNYLYDPDRERRAGEYVALARGDAIPLELHHGQYLSQSNTKARTKADDQRAIRFLAGVVRAEPGAAGTPGGHAEGSNTLYGRSEI